MHKNAKIERRDGGDVWECYELSDTSSDESSDESSDGEERTQSRK